MLGEQAGLCRLHLQLPAVGCLKRGVHWLRKLLNVPPTLSQIGWSGCAAGYAAGTSVVSLSRREAKRSTRGERAHVADITGDSTLRQP